MHVSQIDVVFGFALTALLCSVGCALPEHSAATSLEQATGASPSDVVPPPAGESAVAIAHPPPPTSLAVQPAAATVAAASAPPGQPAVVQAAPREDRQAADHRAMEQFVGELQTMSGLDAATQDQLLEDLRRTDPKLRPLLIQKFRAASEYRDRQRAAAAAPVTLATPQGPTPTAVQPITPIVATLATNPPAAATQHAAPQPDAARPPTDWQQPLAATIRSLEESLAQKGAAGDDRQAQLRLLYLLAGQRDKALQPIDGKDPLEQEFWTKEVYALSTLWDAARQPDRGKRATEAAQQLAEANVRLGQLGLLQVRNLALCTEVSSYGVFRRFEREELRPGEKVVLYAEVENYLSQATPRGYHTALGGSYQIFDSRGQKIDAHELPLMEEHCGNPRRDYFLAYDSLRLPRELIDGKYTLKLSIEDTLGKKVGQSSIDFKVKAAAVK